MPVTYAPDDILEIFFEFSENRLDTLDIFTMLTATILLDVIRIKGYHRVMVELFLNTGYVHLSFL